VERQPLKIGSNIPFNLKKGAFKVEETVRGLLAPVSFLPETFWLAVALGIPHFVSE
jgi:hypothetical protein